MADQHEDLADAFRRMGLSPLAAIEAARGRDQFTPGDVHDLDEAEEALSLEEIVRLRRWTHGKPAEKKPHLVELQETFERLGLSEAAAKVAAEGRR